MSRTFLLLLILFFGNAFKAQDIISLQYGVGSTDLDPEQSATLRDRCGVVEGPVKCKIIGHTDNTGDPIKNLELSLKRAEAVSHHLRELCPWVSVEEIKGVGEADPLASNTTDMGRRLNRRVDMIFSGAEVAVHGNIDQAKAHKHARVQALMPAADKPREVHSVNASSPIEVRMSDGTLLRIPAGSLVDHEGHPVTGNVDLTYRSFLEPWEVIASGIPMHFNNGGDIAHFETAGMYEIYASRNGEQLKLKEGAEMILESEGPPVSTDYTGYSLNETTGEWEPAGRIVDDLSGMDISATMATELYSRMMRRYPMLPDTMSFEERRASDEYCHLTRCAPTRKPFERKGTAIRSPYDARPIPAISVVQDPEQWRKQRRIALQFHVPYRSHPEWQALGGITWIYQGPESNRTLRKAVTKRHFYQDIQLRKAMNRDHFIIRLKDRGVWVELPVRPEFVNERRNASIPSFIARSETRLTNRGLRFDREVKLTLNRKKLEREKIRSRAYQKAKAVMNAEERSMSTDQFERYAMIAGSGDAPLFATDNTYQYARRPTFALPGFGIWNCDRMIPMRVIETPIEVLAQDGRPIKWVKAYGVPANGRQVVTYWNRDGRDQQVLRLSPECERIIFVDHDHDFVIADVPA
ncbi:MAG: OmpA family protein, partial [Bacteroidota bacterium]|nr:OmpA family protein [Bacteroidota bacterium]